MTTPAEQYRALVARLEAIQESPAQAVAQSARSAVSKYNDTGTPDQPPNVPNPPVPNVPPVVNPFPQPSPVTPQNPATTGQALPAIQGLSRLPMSEQQFVVFFLQQNVARLGPQAQKLFTPTANPQPGQTAGTPDQQPANTPSRQATGPMTPPTAVPAQTPGTADKPAQVPPQ